jgi:hypothetical protein
VTLEELKRENEILKDALCLEQDRLWSARYDLKYAQQSIKQLEEAGNALLFYFCPKNTGDVSFLQSEAIKQWNQAKEDKP